MPIDPVSQALWTEIDKYAKQQDKKNRASGYWVKCPSCGRRVVKKELLKKGCYLCGWKQGAILAGQPKHKTAVAYRRNCPQCGRLVITDELTKKGCYVCGYKPEVDVK